MSSIRIFNDTIKTTTTEFLFSISNHTRQMGDREREALLRNFCGFTCLLLFTAGILYVAPSRSFRIFPFFGVSLFFLVLNKAAMMITFDPIEEFIDSKKKKHLNPKLNFSFLAPKCLKMIQTAGSFPGRCVFTWPFNLSYKHQIIRFL